MLAVSDLRFVLPTSYLPVTRCGAFINNSVAEGALSTLDKPTPIVKLSLISLERPRAKLVLLKSLLK